MYSPATGRLNCTCMKEQHCQDTSPSKIAMKYDQIGIFMTEFRPKGMISAVYNNQTVLRSLDKKTNPSIKGEYESAAYLVCCLLPERVRATRLRRLHQPTGRGIPRILEICTYGNSILVLPRSHSAVYPSPEFVSSSLHTPYVYLKSYTMCDR